MKVNFLKKAVAFVTAVTMSLGALANVPAENLSQFMINAYAETGDYLNIESSLDDTPINIGDEFWINATLYDASGSMKYTSYDSFDWFFTNDDGSEIDTDELYCSTDYSYDILSFIIIPLKAKKYNLTVRYNDDIVNSLSFEAVNKKEILASGDCGVDGYYMQDVNYVVDNKNTLTISGNGYMSSYSFSGPSGTNFSDSRAPWFPFWKYIENINVEGDIEIIGAYAFYNCSKLLNVNITDSVTKIGNAAFYKCSSLKTINLPEGLEKIGNNAFGETLLSEVVIPDNVSSIDDYAFLGCTELKKVIIPKNTYIGTNSFGGCSQLTIYGYDNSPAEIYANENNIPFISLDEEHSYTEDDLLNAIKEKSGKEIVNSIYVDFNHDGNKEMLALTPLDSFNREVWFCSSDASKCYYVEKISYGSDYCDLKEIVYSNESHVLYNSGNNFGNGQYFAIYSYKNDEIKNELTHMGIATVNENNIVQVTTRGYDENGVADVSEKSYSYDLNEKKYIEIMSKNNISIGLSSLGTNSVAKGNTATLTFSAYGFDDTSTEIPIMFPSDISYIINTDSYVIVEKDSILNGSLVVDVKGITAGTDNVVVTFNYSDEWLSDNNALNGNNVNEISHNITVNNNDEDNTEPVIPSDGEIIISSDVNGDIVVEEGQCVIISGNVSCNNLFVKGGICNIGTHNDPKSTLTVKNNAEVTGGKTNWASPVSVDEKGGELNVYGTLNVANNMTIGTDCGILNMTTSDCEVNVSNDFTVSTNSTVYTCNLSAGTLTIGGNFISGTSWYNKHNFRASGKHLTLFNGNDFIIKMDETDSYFNNLAFTQSALNNCEYGLDTLYTANVLGKFYIYDDKTTDLSSLFKDYQPIKSSFESKYKKYYYENSAFKTSMNDLKEYVPDDVFNKIIADTEMYCTLEWLNLPSSSNGISIPNAFGASGFTSFLNDKQGVLEFNNIKTDKNTAFKGKKVNVLIFIDNFSITLNSSYASICEIRWAITNSKDEILFASKIPATLTSNSVDNLNEELYQIWKKQSHYKDYKFWVKTFVDDCLDLYGIAGVDVSTAKDVVDLIDSIYESVVNRNLEEFKIASPEDALDLYDNLKDFTNTNSKNFGKITAFLCPVNVKVLDSTGNTVALVENNKVKVSTEAVSIEVLNGDEKYCKFNILDDYQLILTATGKGNMTYRVQELKENNVYRTVTFNNLPLQEGLIYTGSVDELYYASNLAYALTDNNNKTYTADSDTLSTTGDTGNNGGNGNTGGNGSTGNNGNAGSYVPPTTVPSSTPTFPTTIVTRPTLTVKATTKNDTVTLKWNKINNAKKYTVYQLVNGKYVKIKDTDKTSVTFKKLKSGKTYKFLVRYTVNGQKSSNAYSGRISVTVNYKPVVRATATQNSVKLVWDDVPNAQKYAVYKYVNGKAVKLIETKKTSVKINKLAPKTKYQYIVRAYINGKWTTMTKSDIVTATTK